MTKHLPRFLVLITVAIALLGGLGSGLARLGWQMDAASNYWLLAHGPLMISGFLGTLICMERAVALSTRYQGVMLVPVTSALGAITLLLFPQAPLAKGLISFGSVGLLLLFGLMLRLHPSRDIWIMALGALCWVLGNGLWFADYSVYQVVHLWVAFLILTIVGERLELSRVRRLTQRSELLLVVAVGVYLIGTLLTVFYLDFGIRVAGLGAILMAAWLLHYDIARRTICSKALPRYIAACLLIGYVWLAFGGAIALWKGAVYAGYDYALILHAYLLGFVFSMIFGHAPIILPALTGLKLTFTPLFYGHLILLHTTLAYRMLGNLLQQMPLRQWGAMLNVFAILLFIVVTILTVIQSNWRNHVPQRG